MRFFPASAVSTVLLGCALRPEEDEAGREGAREPGRRGRAAPAFPSPETPEARPMSDKNPSPYTRALVLAGPGLALLATIPSLAAGSGLRLLGAVWFCAVLWSLLTALSCVLWRGLRHGDWTAFTRYRIPGGRGERFGLVYAHGPLRLAPRNRGSGTSRSRPGRTLPVAESPSRPAPTERPRWAGRRRGRASGRGSPSLLGQD